MFIGHFAVGFASRRAAPKTPLALLIAAPLFLDLLWPIFLILGIETVRIDPGNTAVTPLDLHDYPYSHSLLMALVWSAAFALVYQLARRDARGALVLGAGVFSHWILDFVTHRPDMPLYPGSTTYLGLGLWRSLPATMAVEIAMFAVSLVLFLRTAPPATRGARIAFWSLIGLLSVSYLGALLGPPPPSVAAIQYSALSAWIVVPWAWYIDHGARS